MEHTMDVVTKATADIVPADNDDESPNGAFNVILSTPTTDRDGENVATEEWKQPLPDHITFDVDHGMNVASTVGSGTPSIDEQGRLVVSGTYSSRPLAQETRSLVNEGHIRTVSVAFLRHTEPVKGGKARVIRELLNGAFVAVPANPEAVILSSKAGARNSKTDQEHLQAAHDATVAAGASCDGMKAGHAIAEALDAYHASKALDTDVTPDQEASAADESAAAAQAAAADIEAADAAEVAKLALRARAIQLLAG
jgi:hypothetical protein